MFNFYDKKFFVGVWLCGAMLCLAPNASKAEVFGLDPTLGNSTYYTLHPSTTHAMNTIVLFDVNTTTGDVSEVYYGLGLTHSGYFYDSGTNSRGFLVKAPYANTGVAVFYDTNLSRLKIDSDTDSISGVSFDKNTSNPGAALLNNKKNINSVDMGFFNNRTTSSNGGGAIMIYSGGNITNLNANFLANSSSAIGGALVNNGTITNVHAGFIGNSAGTDGGQYITKPIPVLAK